MPRRRVGISGATALTVSDTLMEQQVLHERRVQQLDKALQRILRERIEHARAADECRDAQAALTAEAAA
jgi:hypothetical protein